MPRSYDVPRQMFSCACALGGEFAAASWAIAQPGWCWAGAAGARPSTKPAAARSVNASLLISLLSLRSSREPTFDSWLRLFPNLLREGYRYSRHAASRWYSWITPPSRSRLRTAPVVSEPEEVGGEGGVSRRPRCGRSALHLHENAREGCIYSGS